MMLAALQARDLVEVVWVSLAAGVGVTTVFSTALYGATRSAEARRGGDGGAAARYGALAAIAGAIFLVGLVIGVKILVGG